MNFKKIFTIIIMFLFLVAELAFARGGSFGGGGRSSFGGFSGGRSSGFSGGRSSGFSGGSKSFSSYGSKSTSGSKSIFSGSSKTSSTTATRNWAFPSSAKTGGATTYKAVSVPSYGKKTIVVNKTYKVPSDFQAPARTNYHYYGGNDGFMNFMTTYMVISALTQNNSKSEADKLEIARLKAELAKDPKYQENLAMLAKEKAFAEEQKKNESNCFINTLQ